MLKKSITLIGMAGSGKTRMGRMLSAYDDVDLIDVDDFIFERTGRDSAEKLSELGDDGFLDFESGVVCSIEFGDNPMVISSSGSVPLRDDSMKYLHENTAVVWLYSDNESIQERLCKRPDGCTRIVGMSSMTFEEIMEFRHRKYEENADFTFVIPKGLNKEEYFLHFCRFLREKNLLSG